MSASPKNVAGRIVSALACDRKVRVLVVAMQGPAEELRRRHGLGPEAARLAAEGMVAAALLSSQIKGDERNTVNLYGETPRFELMVDVWADGRVRARFTPAELPPTRRFRGVIAVLKFLEERELYRGIADIKDESMEEALARYYAQSVQMDARVRVSAEVDEQGRVVSAAGLLIERFPDMDAAEFSSRFDGQLDLDFRTLMGEFAFGQLAGEPVEILEHLDMLYACPCSKPRVMSMLRSLGAEELASILEEDGKAEVTCHFCNTTWVVTQPELAELLHSMGAAQGDAS